MIVTVARHHAKVPAIKPILAPLRNVAPQLQYVTVALGFQLAATVTPVVVPTDVAHPHAGDFLLAGQGIDILRFAQTIVQTGDEHVVGCRQVSRVAAAFRTQIFIGIRIRVWLRIGIGFTAGQIPVAAVFILTTSKAVVICPRHNTASLNKLTIRYAINMDNFDTINRCGTFPTGVSDADRSSATGITFHHQLIRNGIVIPQRSV